MKKVLILIVFILICFQFLLAKKVFASNIKWRRGVTSKITTIPTEDINGNIYLGTENGQLIKFDLLGNKLFEFETEAGELSTPVIYDNTIYFGSKLSKLFAVSLDGKLKWIFDTNKNEGAGFMDDCYVGNITIDNLGNIYFTTNNTYLYSVKKDGTLNWKNTKWKNFWSPVVGFNNTIICTCKDENVYAIDKKGDILWQYDIGNKYAVESIALSNDSSIIIVSYKKVTSLNYEGKVNWEYETADKISSYPVIDSYNNIYFTDYDNIIYSLSSNGNLNWSHQESKSKGIGITSLAIGDNGLIYYKLFDNLRAINTNGNFESGWSYYKKDDYGTWMLGNNGTIYKVNERILTAVNSYSKSRELNSWSSRRGSSNKSANLDYILNNKNCVFFHRQSLKASTEINFFDKSTGNPSEWKWEFGDGTESSDQNPIHKYDSHGNYLVTLKVSYDTTILTHTKEINTRLFWKYNLNDKNGNAPAIDSIDNVIIGGGAGYHYLYSIDPFGNLNWRKRTKARIEFSPVISSDEYIYVGGFFGNHLSSISTEGEINWELENYSIRSEPAIDQVGNIIIGNNDKYLTSISKEGNINWQINNGNRKSPSVLSTNKIYFGGIFYNNSGEVIGSNNEMSPNTSYCIDKNGNAYYGSENDIVAIDKHGNLLWLYSTNGEISSSPVISDNAVFAGSFDGKLYSINKTNGSLNWSYLTKGLITSSPAIAQNNSIVFSSRDSCIYSLNTDGVLQWKERTRGYITSSPVINSNGTVIVSCSDANIYAFATDNGGLKQNNWSCKGANARHNSYMDIETSTNTNNLSNHIINIYPNPTTGIIQIERLLQNENTVVCIYNVMGQKLKQIKIKETSKTIDISTYKKGTYFLSFNNSFRSAVKIIKE